MKKIISLYIFLSAASVGHASQPLINLLQQDEKAKKEQVKKQKETLKKRVEKLVQKAHSGHAKSALAIYDFCKKCKKPEYSIALRSSLKALRFLGVMDSQGKIDTWKASQEGVYDIMRRYLMSIGVEII